MVNTLDGTSGDHKWYERKEPHLKIESGEAVVQHHCGRCGRDIVTVLSSGARHAVYASVLCFYRLDGEVTERWLNEPCLASACKAIAMIERNGIAKPAAPSES